MTAEPTGRIDRIGDRYALVLSREFKAPITDVWAAVTESERLGRWIGTYTGDPASGQVRFRYTAEEGAPEEDLEIRECEPPRRLAVTTNPGSDAWHLDLVLSETAGSTTLTFTQTDLDPEHADDVGPGWEYYLDRLVAALAGADAAAVDFERDYFPAMSAYYRGRVDAG